MNRPTTDRRSSQTLGSAIGLAGAITHDLRATRRVSFFSGFTQIVAVLGLLVTLIAVPAIANGFAQVPSPLSGPGIGEMKKSQRKKIDRGWRALNAGDRATSRKRISSVAQIPAAQLLELQILRQEQSPELTELLRSFCEHHAAYAAAWITLSISAEEAGLEDIAIDAAQRGAKLWPTSKWAERADTLYARWIDDRIAAAESLIDAGKTADARTAIDAALALDPERRDAVFLIGKIHLQNGEVNEAEEILAEFPELPDAIYLRGTIAEERGDWQSAMELFSALPPSHPERSAAMDHAQTQWRLTLLPAYAQTAMRSTKMTRGELAIVLVSLQPRLKTLPGGDVPVMSDIVDYSGQREIITVVRLGIMQADRRGHLFLPNAPTGTETAAEALNRSRTLLGLPPRSWCAKADMVGSGCHFIGSPPNGGSVVRAVLDTLSGAE